MIEYVNQKAHYTITNKAGNVTLIHPIRSAHEAAADAERHESPLITVAVTRDGTQESQTFPCLQPSPEDGTLIRRPATELAEEIYAWCLVRGFACDDSEEECDG